MLKISHTKTRRHEDTKDQENQLKRGRLNAAPHPLRLTDSGGVLPSPERCATMGRVAAPVRGLQCPSTDTFHRELNLRSMRRPPRTPPTPKQRRPLQIRTGLKDTRITPGAAFLFTVQAWCGHGHQTRRQNGA